jgi:hypothetical protein
VDYRWSNAFVQAEITCNVTFADLNRFWNDERRLSNQPLLLIDLTGRTLTLGFHPQHGDLLGIEKIKQPFKIAFHRGRPDCGLTWFP